MVSIFAVPSRKTCRRGRAVPGSEQALAVRVEKRPSGAAFDMTVSRGAQAYQVVLIPR